VAEEDASSSGAARLTFRYPRFFDGFVTEDPASEGGSLVIQF
jgi:hypothetical protein